MFAHDACLAANGAAVSATVRPFATAPKLAAATALLVLASPSAYAAIGAAASRPADVPMRVALDPGHGGIDRGAVRGDLKESQITLRIAGHVADLLRSDPRFQVMLTREKDEHLALAERARAAKAWKADVLLSIHANSNEDPRAQGVGVYFQNQLPADEESLFLAARENGDVADPRDSRSDDDISAKGDLASILEDLRRSSSVRASFELSRALMEAWASPLHRRPSRSIRQAPFYLVSRGSMPAALLEVGFITNPEEARRLADSGHQRKLAERIFEGLARFKETVDKDRGRLLKSADAI